MMPLREVMESSGHFDILKNDNRRLFEDNLFLSSDKRGNFLFQDITKYPEVPNTQYPYILITGRGGIGLWHTLTRTRNIPAVEHMYPLDSHIHSCSLYNVEIL